MLPLKSLIDKAQIRIIRIVDSSEFNY